MEHPHATNHTSLNIVLLFFTGIFKILEESSLRWTYLKESQLGRGILGMIALDLTKYPNLEQQ